MDIEGSGTETTVLGSEGVPHPAALRFTPSPDSGITPDGSGDHRDTED